MAPFLAGAGLWLAVRFARAASSRRRVVVPILALAAGFALPAVPVGWQCRRITGEFAILPGFGGVNAHIGNNPHRDETLRIRPGYHWRRLIWEPRREGVVGLWEENRYFYRRVKDYIAEDFGGFVRGLGAKTLQFVSSREIPRNRSLYALRPESRLLAALAWKVGGFGFPFGVLLPLAALGAWVHRRRIPGPILLFLALYPPAVVAVFVADRYRLTVVPALAILAGGGATALGQALVARRWRILTAQGAAVAALAILVSVPARFAVEQDDVFEAERLRDTAAGQAAAGRLREAESSLRRALEARPGDLEALLALGTVLSLEGRHAEARAAIAQVLRVAPDYPMAHWTMGAVLDREGDIERALAAWREAVRHDPGLFEAHAQLGRALARLGRWDEARPSFEAAVALRPDSEEARALEELRRARR
jgi:tetratricopeptide (TPR) repeat protein